MKKFTFMLIASLFAIAGFAQKPLANGERFSTLDRKVQNVMVQAPRTLTTGTMNKAPRKAAEDYVVISEQPEGELKTYARGGSHYYVQNSSLYYGSQSGTIDIVWAADNKVYFKDIVSGLEFDTWVEGTLSEDGKTITVPLFQNISYVASYDACIAIQLINYVSGTGFTPDTETKNVTFTVDDDVLSLQGTGFTSVSLGGVWTDDGSIQDYGDFETVYKPYVAPELVVLPDGLEILPYVMKYIDGDGNDVSTPINVAVDGNDVYFQGMSYYIPDAWVKGTMSDNTVTFPSMQYMGEYGTYGSSFFFYNGETVFTYDPEAGTYSAEGQVFGVLADTYYDGNYTDPVLSPVVEKAVMPANPQITGIEDSSWGKIVEFNIPVIDVNGDALASSKLYYKIYSDIEHEITPLTFTPETHTKLTENITEIPYGFTEEYDFYSTFIYLNELYSEDWNKIGIQSIYYGGGETNATEIQWFKIKDYAFTSGDVTFDFNAMDVPVSASGVTDGDFAENKSFTAVIGETDNVITLTVTPNDERCTTPNRFWSTNAGPQLRVYSGTMTFEVPAGYTITSVVFNYNGKYWGGANNAGNVTADSGEITDNADVKQATWTGDAQSVVFSIGYYDEENSKWISGNTQINSIVVTIEAVEIKPIEAPEDLVTETYIFQGFDTYYEEDVTSKVQVGFYGENEVYIQGLSTGYLPDAWVKGTIEGGVVTIPETYLGVWTYDGTDYEITFAGASFVYDAEAETFTSEEGYTTYTGKYLLDEFANVVLTKFNGTVVTVSDALYATYVAPCDVDFTGAEVSAYAVTVIGEYAHLEPVTTVPAGTAVVVKAAAAGTYDVAKTTDATLDAPNNELVAATEDVVADGTQYILAKVDDVVGFYKASGTIAAGKGYLSISSPVKAFYGFGDDDATAISGIVADENAVIYNLAGQRVSKAVKGINIINGKKVLK